MHGSSHHAVLVTRLEEPFSEPWANVRTSEGMSLWFAQDWQKRLWGAMWTWQYVFKKNPWTCMDFPGVNSTREVQLRALIRGVVCEDPFCHAWHRLFRRFRALTKVMAPEDVSKLHGTRLFRYTELTQALHDRFGFLDASEIDPSPMPSESREIEVLEHA